MVPLCYSSLEKSNAVVQPLKYKQAVTTLVKYSIYETAPVLSKISSHVIRFLGICLVCTYTIILLNSDSPDFMAKLLDLYFFKINNLPLFEMYVLLPVDLSFFHLRYQLIWPAHAPAYCSCSLRATSPIGHI
jgi:hypothetical protein